MTNALSVARVLSVGKKADDCVEIIYVRDDTRRISLLFYRSNNGPVRFDEEAYKVDSIPQEIIQAANEMAALAFDELPPNVIRLADFRRNKKIA